MDIKVSLSLLFLCSCGYFDPNGSMLTSSDGNIIIWETLPLHLNTLEHQGDLDNAIDTMNTEFGYNVFQYDSEAKFSVSYLSQDQYNKKYNETNEIKSIGMATWGFSSSKFNYFHIDMRDGLTKQDCYETLAHELGHIVGLKHTQDCSVMGEQHLDCSGGFVVINDKQLALFQQTYSLDTTSKNE